MPIKAYIGLPRNGKSYEVVSQVILPSLRQGRRVVSNIAGLNEEAFRLILHAEGLTDDKIGQLVSVTHDQVLEPDFFRTDEDDKNGKITFVQPGDLVALDEVWRFWPETGNIPERHMNFFRTHGHMTHPITGFCFEVALITQDITDLNKKIRGVVAETYLMVKNTKIGSDKSYIVHVFARARTTKAGLIRTLAPRMYNPEFFPLYKSHSQHHDGDAAPVEANPDDRGNILKGALFKIVLPVGLLICCFAGYMLWRFFHPVTAENLEVKKTLPAVAQSQISESSVSEKPEVKTIWRVSGHYFKGGQLTVILQDAKKNTRYLQNPPNYKLSPLGFEVMLPDGSFATSWTAQSDSGGLLK